MNSGHIHYQCEEPGYRDWEMNMKQEELQQKKLETIFMKIQQEKLKRSTHKEEAN